MIAVVSWMKDIHVELSAGQPGQANLERVGLGDCNWSYELYPG